jgi:hypothetical protein
VAGPGAIFPAWSGIGGRNRQARPARAPCARSVGAARALVIRKWNRPGIAYDDRGLGQAR